MKKIIVILTFVLSLFSNNIIAQNDGIEEMTYQQVANISTLLNSFKSNTPHYFELNAKTNTFVFDNITYSINSPIYYIESDGIDTYSFKIKHKNVSCYVIFFLKNNHFLELHLVYQNGKKPLIIENTTKTI